MRELSWRCDHRTAGALAILRRCALLVAVALGCGAAACGDSRHPATDAGVPADAPAPPDAASPDAACTCTATARCLDATTLETSLPRGACVAGACSYDAVTSPCPFGCQDGACQAEACVPSCPAATCGDDGCGGSCGACDPGTTLPGVTPVELGTAGDLFVSPDGIHVATMRAFEPPCNLFPSDVGRLDVWTVPVGGAPSHRTIGARVSGISGFGVTWTSGGDLLYLDRSPPCSSPSELWIAHADGSQPRRLASGVLSFRTAGAVVVYDSQPDLTLYAIQLPDGRPIPLTSYTPDNLLDFYELSPDGTAVWSISTPAQPTGPRDVRLLRTDGSLSRRLVLAGESPIGLPIWAPDSKHLAYSSESIGGAVVDRDGNDRVILTQHPGGEPFQQFAVFSADGHRLAFIDQPAQFELDVVIHSFDGRPEVRIGSVVSPTVGGMIVRLAFSADGSRIYATTSAGVDAPTSDVMTGRTDASGTAQLFAAGAGRWSESLDGSVVAVNGSNTQVITLGGGTQTIAGPPFELARFEPVATNPRLLVQSGDFLSVYPTSGAGPGIPLPLFFWTTELSNWAGGHNAPFPFGWAGSMALYPADTRGVALDLVSFDLLAWTPSASGRLLSRVARYQIVDNPSRIYAMTDSGRLFMIPRPAASSTLAR